MMNQDFRQFILDQKKDELPVNFANASTVLDYMELVKEKPETANISPARIYNMIMRHGIEQVPESLKTSGYEDLVRYKFFDGKIFGTLEPIHDIMKFLKAAARRTETGKRILIMVGPVASGKSTIASLIKKGIEMDTTPIFAMDGCPLHEDPLHAIPEEHREFWQEKLGVRIEGKLCPVCQLKAEQDFIDEENGKIKWHELPVTQIRLSEQKRIGIGTFQPSDPKSQDISELIGSINMAKIATYGSTDPRAYQFDGELEVGNRGVVEYIEILKADIKFHHVLLTVTQEQVIKAPRFPQIGIDTLILSHTNQTEFDKFRADKANEALQDRMYAVPVPWNDRVSDEIEIYKKMINESDFRDIHIAPGTIEVAAQFAILSRLYTGAEDQINPIKKMKLYDGQYVEEFSKGRDIDVRKMRETGRKNGEGMKGISPRFIMNSMNVALGSKEDKKCITPLDLIKAMKSNFDHHIGFEEKDVKKYLTVLFGDKDSVVSEYKDFAKREVSKAFVHAFDDQAEELYLRYIINCQAFCKNDTVYDETTGEYHEPDEKIMRAIEELVPVTQESKKEFRQGIFVYKSDFQDRGEEFNWRSYRPLREAIEKKLMNDLKNVVTLSIADTTTTSPKAKERRDSALETLRKKGYCPHCANIVLQFVAETLRREN